MNPLHLIQRCFRLNLIKTLYFNLRYFGLSEGLKMPIYIYRHTKLQKCGGKIIIKTFITRGMIRIGEHHLATVNPKTCPSIWMVDNGTVIFNGQAFLAQGTKICVDLGGELEFGSHVSCTGNSEIICNKKIYLGDDSLISWNVLIMDTDGHKICNANGIENEYKKAIYIGKHVWIGCRVSLLKGSYIPDNCIIGAGSIISQKFSESNCTIVSGSRPEIISRNKYWKK